MSMTLTKDDLAAIRTMIGDMINHSSNSLETRLEAKLVARIDELDDRLSMQTEHGLQEVRDQIQSVKEVVDRIDRVQQAELERNDRQDATIHQMRKSLHAA